MDIRKRPSGAEKARFKKGKALEEDAAKCAKLTCSLEDRAFHRFGGQSFQEMALLADGYDNGDWCTI